MVTLWTSSPDWECGLNALSVRVMFTGISSGAAWLGRYGTPALWLPAEGGRRPPAGRP